MTWQTGLTRNADRRVRRIALGATATLVLAAVALSGSRGEPISESGPKPHVVAPVVRRDCPMFGVDGSRNQINLIDTNLPITWHADAPRTNIKWSAALGSRSYGAVVVSGGKVFVGSNNERPRNSRDRRITPNANEPPAPEDKGILMCFDEETGRFLWQAVHDKLESGQVNDWPREGLPSTPAVEGNRVYYVSNRCELICADTEGFLDGKNDGVQDEKYKTKIDADIIWRLDMMRELNVFPHNMAICAPLIVGDLVFVVTANGVDENHLTLPSPDAPSFIAVNKHTGKLVWGSNLPGKNIMHGQWSNATYGEAAGVKQVIFPGGDGWLYAFDPPTGKFLWKFDCNPKSAKYELGGKATKSDFIATPVVYKGRVYIATGQDPEHYDGVGHLWCIDLTRAVQKGRVNKDNDVSPADDVFDPNADGNKERSALVWHFGGYDHRPKSKRDFLFGRTMSTCAIHDGLVYIAEIAGYMNCLDAETGQRYWIHDLKSSVWGSAYYVDGKVYVPTEDGDVFIFAHGKEKKLLSKVEMDEPIRGSVVAVNGVLFIKTEKTLYAIQAEK
jgi:outer membrane protein assembly factor BamB